MNKNLLLLILIIIVICLPIARAELVGYWDFEEGNGTTAIDKSGNNYHGQFQGDPNYTSTSKMGDYAIHLDGNDTVDINRDILGSQYTVMAWIRYDYISSGFQHAFGQSYSGLETRSYGFDYYYRNTSPYCFHASASLTKEIWYHIAIVTSSTTKSIYLDGNVIGSVNDTSNFDPSNDFFIGSNNGSVEFVTGIMDDVAVFSTALSQSEIQSVMTNGAGVPEPGLLILLLIGILGIGLLKKI